MGVGSHKLKRVRCRASRRERGQLPRPTTLDFYFDSIECPQELLRIHKLFVAESDSVMEVAVYHHPRVSKPIVSQLAASTQGLQGQGPSACCCSLHSRDRDRGSTRSQRQLKQGQEGSMLRAQTHAIQVGS
ncbi:hypothetical protein CCR75_002691 [Bremia lactucae]|uniref:Uncharacterized protein n=1 Tax=Bremia lactucae TaxID=4779 RepID=A0A976IG43_BRELC|nr:hypothetical protein CCR75_002691 [Bremia lactucae]